MKKLPKYFVTICALLFVQPALSQNVVWEQKLDLLHSCTPQSGGASISAIAQADDGTLYVSDPSYLWRSVDNGESWESLAFEYSHIEGIVPLNSDSMLVGVWGSSQEKSGIYLVREHGEIWEKTDVGEPIEFMRARSDNSVIYGADENRGLFVSTDRGLSWTEVLPDEHITEMTVGHYGVDFLFSKKSTDGLNWEPVSPSGNLLYPTSSPNIFLTSRPDGIYRSENDGSTWQLVLDSDSGILITSSLGDIYSISTTGEVSASSDNGSSWIPFARPSPDSCGRHTTIALDSDGNIWSGTVNGAVFRSSASTLVLNDEVILTPDQSFSIDVYPNPTSGYTNINIVTVSNEVSRVDVYNLLGQRIDHIHNGFLSAGTHAFVWDGSRVPSGLYLVRYVSPTNSSYAIISQVRK